MCNKGIFGLPAFERSLHHFFLKIKRTFFLNMQRKKNKSVREEEIMQSIYEMMKFYAGAMNCRKIWTFFYVKKTVFKLKF